MSKEKQIEEIANVIYDDPNAYDTYWRSHCERLAETIYNAGYRKQSVGEWAETDYKTFEHGFVERRGKAWKCTNCLHASKRFDNHMKFCPNCGARMKGGAEQ